MPNVMQVQISLHLFTSNFVHTQDGASADGQMHTEHHIDAFDLSSFFALHDFNSDGQWDEAEIQAVYGLHHHSVKDKMPKDHVDSRADVVVKKVLEKLDKDKNGESASSCTRAGA